MNKLTRNSALILLLLSVILTPHMSRAQTSFKFQTLVIDPGHGGEPGAIYGSITEESIVLKVAKIFGEKVKSNYPEIEVIYTRQSNKTTPLYSRGATANNAHADLFISIHANSAKSTSASGTETYIMGYDKSAANMEIAKKENSVVTFESDYDVKYEGFDPNSDESYIIFSLMQQSYITQSSLLAAYIQEEYTKNSKLKNRGVKQAPFLVLWQSAMPSVLTEIGFLSNSSDRQYINSASGQEQIAQSLFNAFKRYKEHLEMGEVAADTYTPIASSKTKPSSSQTIESNNNVTFYVQVKSSGSAISINSQNFGKYYKDVKSVKEGGLYKYLVGNSLSFKEALSLQSDVRKYMFKDAFVVAYKDGKRTTITDSMRNK